MEHCAECGFTYRLAEAPAVVAAVVAAICTGTADIAAVLTTDADLTTRPRPDVWSPLEYASHVRDVLLVQRERVLTARRVERPDLPPMGRDERAEHEGYNEQNPADVARQLADAALLFCTVLNRLERTDWDRTLMYNLPGPIEKSISWVAVHTQHEIVHHLMDIRRQLP